MERIPEPEIMDDPKQALAYARADFAEVNAAFVERLRAALGEEPVRRIVDLGCGPADIPLRIARLLPAVALTAVDASAPMLALAREAVRAGGFRSRIALVRASVPALPLKAGAFDVIVSNSLLHHLREPRSFWREVARLGQSGGLVLVVDLLRPETPARAREIVEREAGGEEPVLQRDFYNSLLAAFTPAEVRGQLDAGLSHLDCRPVSDRHWMVCGRIP
ncbi:MAG: class I SAM-dependent methyltransferase [Candidatus Binatia bacterium]